MEKLVLRGVMYGADKIPDTWFEKVPGNYYKSKQQPQNGQVEPQQRDDRRRHSDEYDDRRRHSDEYEDRYHNGRDTRRDSHRARSSFDRDDPNDKRSYDDRYRYDSGYGGEDRYDEPRHRRDYRDPNVRRYDDLPVRDLPSPTTAAETGFAAGVTAAHIKDRGLTPPPPAPYVPYAHIYGNNQQPAPPPSSIGSPQPHSMNQFAAHRGSVEDYPDRRYRRGYDGPDDRYDGHQDRSRPRRPPMRSRSYDSFDSRDDHRRRQPEHPAEAYGRHRGKSPGNLRDTFDKSQRGLGYGAVGAIAGGLVGSGVGKGPVPAAIGAVLGGLGANMFEARERFVPPNQTQERRTSDKKRCDPSLHQYSYTPYS